MRTSLALILLACLIISVASARKNKKQDVSDESEIDSFEESVKASKKYSKSTNDVPRKDQPKKGNKIAGSESESEEDSESEEQVTAKEKISKWFQPKKKPNKYVVNHNEEDPENHNRYMKMSAYDKWALKNRKKFEKLDKKVSEEYDSSEEDLEAYGSDSDEKEL